MYLLTSNSVWCLKFHGIELQLNRGKSPFQLIQVTGGLFSFDAHLSGIFSDTTLGFLNKAPAKSLWELYCGYHGNSNGEKSRSRSIGHNFWVSFTTKSSYPWGPGILSSSGRVRTPMCIVLLLNIHQIKMFCPEVPIHQPTPTVTSHPLRLPIRSRNHFNCIRR